jgi:hypothetical protein
MSPTTRVSLVGTAALAIAGTAFAGGSDNDALTQIAELKQELAELKAQNGDAWLTEQRAAEVRGIVQDVLADADTRTSLQDSGASAGWNNGFFTSSADGNFKLNVGGLVQVRWMLNDAAEQSNTWGFANARTSLNFSGNVVDPSWTYRVRLNTGAFASSDFMYVEKAMDNGMSIRAGQFKAPFMRESLVEDGHQLAVNRSQVHADFNTGFSQGVQFGYNGGDAWHVDVAYVNALGTTGNTGLQNPYATNWSLAGRFEYKFAGTWDQFADDSSFRGEEFGAMLGVGFAGERANGIGDKVWGLTVDGTFQFGGANAGVAFVHATSDPAVGDSVSPWGLSASGGYFVTDDIEVFGRYDHINYDVDGADNYSAATLGMNYFLGGHNAKFTVDWSMNLNSVDGTSSNFDGWRVDAADETNQWVLRAQMQLMF